MVISKKLLAVAAIIAALAGSMNLSAMNEQPEPNASAFKYLLLQQVFKDATDTGHEMPELAGQVMQPHEYLLLADEIVASCKDEETLFTAIEKTLQICGSKQAIELFKMKAKHWDCICYCGCTCFSETILDYTAQRGYSKVVTLILEIADKNSPYFAQDAIKGLQELVLMRDDRAGQTALVQAVFKELGLKIVQLFLKAAGNKAQDLVLSQNVAGGTVLSWTGEEDIIMELLTAAGDKALELAGKQHNSTGCTVLHDAVSDYRSTRANIVKCLVNLFGDEMRHLVAIKNINEERVHEMEEYQYDSNQEIRDLLAPYL